ncbi:MAG: DUF3592 domain-containing protein [Candidatus Omnitrophica bacterium]|nr:DUF3592 domain-containing protein [Candidatus Omnitrophota bacterium]MBU1995832.1 DUF3592 domain-containing protein [Candidatus Omnitrophota bacterium]MBU4332921.1 DUF3592 domain-containing protein [Candidatus Omnitrophota bacterium]
MSKKNKNDEMPLSVCVGILVFGLLLLTLGLKGLTFKVEMSDWAKTEGIIISSKINDVSTSGQYQINPRFVPEVAYKYFVGEQEFVSGQFANVYISYGSRNELDKKMKAIKVGDEVEVFFNPNNPKQAFLVIEKPSITTVFVFLSFGVMTIILGVLVLLVRLKVIKQ